MPLALLVITGWLLCVCLHEFGHALVAYLGGDDSVKSKGYLSLNILRYIDPGLSLILPAIIMAMGGIGLPGAAVYINEGKLRNRFWRSATSAAGPGATVLVTCALAWVVSQSYFELELWIRQGLSVVILFNVASTFLNLTPIPPLDGYGVVEPWLPKSLQGRIRSIPPATGIVAIMFLFSFVPAINDALWTATFSVVDLLQVSHRELIEGYDQFHKYGMVVVIVLLVGIAFLSKRKSGTQPATSGPENRNFSQQPAPSETEARQDGGQGDVS